MAGWHHWLDGHGFGWNPGIWDGRGGLACCGSWGHKEVDTTEWLNWTELSSSAQSEPLFLSIHTHKFIHTNTHTHSLNFTQLYIKILSHFRPLIWCFCVCVSRSVISDSATPWTVARQAPLSMEFSRQEHWSGCHYLLQGIFSTVTETDCRQMLYCLRY